MAVGLADLGGFRRSMDAICRLGQRDPYRPHGAVRPWRDLQDLGVLPLLEVDLRIVGIARIERDTLHRVGAAWGRRVRRPDGRRIGGDQRAALVVSENLLDALMRHDARDLALLRFTRIGDLDDRAGNGEINAGVEFLQIGLVHVESLGQRFRGGRVGHGGKLSLGGIVIRDGGDIGACRIGRGDRVVNDRHAAAVTKTLENVVGVVRVQPLAGHLLPGGNGLVDVVAHLAVDDAGRNALAVEKDLKSDDFLARAIDRCGDRLVTLDQMVRLWHGGCRAFARHRLAQRAALDIAALGLDRAGIDIVADAIIAKLAVVAVLAVTLLRALILLIAIAAAGLFRLAVPAGRRRIIGVGFAVVGISLRLVRVARSLPLLLSAAGHLRADEVAVAVVIDGAAHAVTADDHIIRVRQIVENGAVGRDQDALFLSDIALLCGGVRRCKHRRCCDCQTEHGVKKKFHVLAIPWVSPNKHTVILTLL